jgi:hypothetical protein
MQSFIDSSSSDNFIDKEYTSQHNFCIYSIPSVQLQLFDGSFGEEISQAIDLDIQFPTGDGQTEQTNQTLEQYLCIYCNYQQDNWSHLLPLTKFAFNNSPSTITGISPFFANKGYYLNLSIHMDCELIST